VAPANPLVSQVSVPIGGGLFVYLSREPTPLRLVEPPLVNAWGALQRWIEADPEKRVWLWRADWFVLLFNLWREGLIELWGRDAPSLGSKLTRLDYVVTERFSRLFGPLDFMRWRLQYLPDERWFYDLHVRAVVAADVVPNQPELPIDDPRDAPTVSTAATAAAAPKQQRPGPAYFTEADSLLAGGLDPEDPHCWTQISKRLEGKSHYYIERVRLAVRWRAFDQAQSGKDRMACR
jgi:hypothetical protein